VMFYQLGQPRQQASTIVPLRRARTPNASAFGAADQFLSRRNLARRESA